MTSVDTTNEAIINSEYLLVLKTVQSSIFRVLIEALKDILPDTCIEFNPMGVRILTIDATHVVLVHLKLDGTQFEKYYCPSKLVIGVNMQNFFKLIKTMNNNETLTLFIEKNDSSRLGIKIENGDKNTTTNFKLNLLDLDEEQIEVPDAAFSSVINIPSSDFQKTCRDMCNLATNVEITSVGSQLRFKCHGEFAQQETIMGETTNSNPGCISYVGGKKESTDIIQGIFTLKHLVLFTKCTNLSPTIKMYLENDFPLIIMYPVGSLGEIKFCLAPKNESKNP